MATLNIKLEESKTESKAIFMIECSNDVSNDIIKMTEEKFAKELKESGNIIPGQSTTKIQMILLDKEKIDQIKDWIAKKFVASLSNENLNTSA